MEDLYKQKEREQENLHDWEYDDLLKVATQSFHRHINDRFLGTDDRISRERQKIALETNLAFDSLAYIHCPEHLGAEVSVIRDKGKYFFCKCCTNKKIEEKISGLKSCIRDIDGRGHNADLARRKSKTESDFNIWKDSQKEYEIQLESLVKDLELYKKALEVGDYRKMLSKHEVINKLAYECPKCRLIVPGTPLAYKHDEHKLYVCKVCYSGMATERNK